MVSEKPWSKIHLDHEINFMGSNWLVLIDAYSKYPFIHSITSTSTRSTISILEENFVHFGYPHTIITDNATSFTSEEFNNGVKTKELFTLLVHLIIQQQMVLHKD